MTTRILAAGLLFLLAGPAVAAVGEHPDFTEDRNRPARIVLLPVQSSITRGRLTDAESLIKETEVLEQALTREAASALQALGYELDTEIVSAEALASNEGLLAIMDEARDRAYESLGDASRDPKGIGMGRFTIEDSALPLAAHSGAEGLLVLQSQSFIVSKGSKALGAILNPFNLTATATRTQVFGGLFDMRDGQLLAVFTGRDVGPVLKKPDGVARQVIASAFSDYPRLGSAQPAKAKLRRAAPPRDLEPVPATDKRSAADTLAAFEEAAASAEEPVDRDAAPDLDGGVETEPEGTESAEAAEPTESAPQPPASGEPAPALSTDEQELLLALLDAPPEARPAPTLQVVLLGDVGATALAVRNMSPEPVRVSIDRSPLVEVQPGGLLELEVKPGSHRLLVAHAEGDRELARAAVTVREGRVGIVELWPAGN